MEDADNINFDIPLVAANNEQAGFKFHNATPDEAHRVYVTGSERKKSTTTVVRGRLIHVVHGFHSLSFPSYLNIHPDDQIHNIDLAEGDSTPYTLIVLQWTMVPGSLEARHRFRTVSINLVFSASGSRPGVPPPSDGGDLTPWDPVPTRISPCEDNPMLSHFTPVSEESSSGFSLGPTVGYDGIASLNAEYTKSQKVAVQFAAAARISGEIWHCGRISGQPNAVGFSFFENPKAKTGVPPVVRTAVLLRRQKRDRKGKFAMAVEVASDVNWWQDAKEKMRKAVGVRYRDDPVNFDPGVSYVVQDGEKVESEKCKVPGVDWRRLGELDLNRFLVNYVDSASMLKEEVTSKEKDSSSAPALDMASLTIEDKTVSDTARASKDDASTVSDASTRVNSDDYSVKNIHPTWKTERNCASEVSDGSEDDWADAQESF